jgi:vacuolar-type H+-ATPase subunit I/STV1
MPARNESFDDYLESIEKQARAARLFSLAITFIPVLIALVALVITINQIRKARSELAQTKAQLDNATQELTKKREEVTQIANILSLSPDELLQIYNYGWQTEKIKTANANPALVEQSLKANEALQQLLKTADAERRKSTTVGYFPKNVDAGKVDAALKGFGFNLVRLTPIIKDTPTNAVFFGTKVNQDDVKIIAYTLIRAGVQLKGIAPFKVDTSIPLPEGVARDSYIAVVSNNNPIFLQRQYLTVEDIRNRQEFKATD